jgi:uncharacterized protein (TIGR01777 family)
MSITLGKIVILGGTGFVGTALREALPGSLLLRSRSRGPGGYDVASGWMDAKTLQGADVVINLAGSPIAVRWTARARAQIRESRAGTTLLLVNTLRDAGITPRVIVSMSGANRYAANADAQIDESSPLDDNSFLGGICRDWESPLETLPQETRVAILRTGVVIGPGGAMAKLAPLFRLGLGGRLGDGYQWMPWINRGDLIRLILFCMAENGPRGVLNAVNPLPVTNREFTQIIARGVRRPAILPAPAWALRLAYGQMAQEALLDSRRVVPTAALSHGFHFDQPASGLADSVRQALAAL